MTPAIKQIMKRQHEAFRQKFGREPGPNDPVFFDPNAETPQQIKPGDFYKAMREAIKKARQQ